MTDCIIANHCLLVDTIGLDSVYVVRVTSLTPTIRIHFAPPRDQDAIGSVDGVCVTPSGPEHGTDWVEFTTSDLDATYTVHISYTDPPGLDRSVPRLETPTKSPKFKPRATCPTHEP